MRLFVAVPASEAVRAEAARVLAELSKTGADCKWVEPDHLHWTLHFFGEMPESMLSQIEGLLSEAADTQRPFKVKLGAAGGFPSSDSPRVVWIGLSEGEAEMERLASALRDKLKAADFVVEERPFRAHLTLGRVRSPKGLAGLAKALETAEASAEMGAERLCLMQSKLSSQGPTYVELFDAPLGGRL
jgi:RNA 2',3'-cyclic 3'-phosphodiesterase